jgi:hypothetical protein
MRVNINLSITLKISRAIFGRINSSHTARSAGAELDPKRILSSNATDLSHDWGDPTVSDFAS